MDVPRTKYFNSPTGPDGKEDFMKYVHSFMDIRVADMAIGSLWAGKGLSARTINSVCPCCHRALGEHDVVRCVYAASKGATGHKTLIGDDCKHESVPVDVRKNAPRLELHLLLGDDAESTLGALKWAMQNQTYSVEQGRNVKGQFDKTATMVIYITGSCSGIGKLGKTLSETGVQIREQRMYRDGEFTNWEPVDTSTWAKFLGCGLYHGTKAYGV